MRVARFAFPLWFPLGLGIACGIVALAWYQGYLLCPVAFLTGYPCPSCGMTRAFSAILSGNFRAAFTYHPLGPVVALGAATYVVAAAVRHVRGRNQASARRGPVFTHRSTRLCVLLAGVLLIGVWVVRLCGGLGGPATVRSPLSTHEMFRR